MTDRELVGEFVKHRSEQAFEALVQRHIDLVFGTAFRLLHDSTAAQEIAQEVFVALARKAPWLSEEISLGMAPEQAAAIDQGFENLTSLFRNLEVQRLEPSATHASREWPGEKTSYRIPALYEEMKSPMESFFAQNASILGESCAEVFNHWAQLCITGALGGFAPKTRILTFTEVPLSGNRQLTRFEVAEEGGKQLYYNEVANPPFQELPPGLPPEFHRLPYEHLFGERWDNRHKPDTRSR